MSRIVTVNFEVGDNVTNDQLHEALCLAIHEGVGINDRDNSGLEVLDISIPEDDEDIGG